MKFYIILIKVLQDSEIRSSERCSDSFTFLRGPFLEIERKPSERLISFKFSMFLCFISYILESYR